MRRNERHERGTIDGNETTMEMLLRERSPLEHANLRIVMRASTGE